MLYEQKERVLEVATPLGPEKLMLTGLTGMEAISEPFLFRLQLASDDGFIDLKNLIRKPFMIKLKRQSGSSRIIHGLVNHICQLGMDSADEPVYYYQAEIVPWLWFLRLNADIRIFQDKTVPEIIEEVFQKARFNDFAFKLQDSYPKREYCVQYRESDFNFISRLLEEEGIFYYFLHEEAKHTLVLADQVSITENCPHGYKISYGKGTGTSTEGEISEIVQEHHARTGKITLRDYDFEKSTVQLEAVETSTPLSEVYDFPGGYRTRDAGSRYARIRLEEHETKLRAIHGRGIATTLIPGYRFELTDHFNKLFNRPYLILKVDHVANTNVFDTSESGQDYECCFEALELGVPYRPPHRAVKPLVHGVQTALVVGQSGEEIWVDKYGRVKVQFYWDRLGREDESSSCWIRTSQAWAGSNWGHIQLPRVGQEVIVSFLEGDPDRPLITGRVYNDQNMPPYDLPANSTQSGIKSRSLKQGGPSNFNEIRFEDKKGDEQVYLHAEKDFDNFVENKMTITVDKSDQVVQLNQGNQETTIQQGDQTTTLNMGNQKTSLQMGNKTTELALGNYTVSLDAGQYSLSAMTGVKIECGLSKITMTPASIDIEVGAAKISLNPAMVVIQSPIVKIN
jgi:type VI secretion system secreted protein VgrG